MITISLQVQELDPNENIQVADFLSLDNHDGMPSKFYSILEIDNYRHMKGVRYWRIINHDLT